MAALPSYVFHYPHEGYPDLFHREQGKSFEEAVKHWPRDKSEPVLHHIEWEKYAWPGGYPIYYLTKDGGCLCSKCANDNLELTLGDDPQWQITDADINYEDTTLYCDNCQEFIESAYGDDEDDEAID